jgi:hypothetical protein
MERGRKGGCDDDGGTGDGDQGPGKERRHDGRGWEESWSRAPRPQITQLCCGLFAAGQLALRSNPALTQRRSYSFHRPTPYRLRS